MNFQRLGTSGDTEMSDCRRYMITRVKTWGRDSWEAWATASLGPNTRIGQHFSDKAAAHDACRTHQQTLSPSQIIGAT